MRLPTIADDYWTLRSGEASHREHPTTFSIPPVEARTSLQRGQAAKLIFEMEGVCLDDNSIETLAERMWVVVTGRVGDVYLGILVDTPVSEESDGFHLRRWCEVPFLAEHVIDIDDPPPEVVEEVLAREPSTRWPR